MSTTYEVSLEFLFASPLEDESKAEFFRFLDEIASLPRTQVWIETNKELYVGKMPEHLFMKRVADVVEQEGGWLKINKQTTKNYLYSDAYAYSVTIVTLNLQPVITKIHEYCHVASTIKRGKVLLRKNGREVILVPCGRQFSEEELTMMIQ